MNHIYIPAILLLSFINYCNASFSDLPSELKNEVLNNLSKTDATKVGPVNKEMHKLVKENTQCPVLNIANIRENQNLANATTNQMHDLVGEKVTILGRTYQISYLYIGFLGTFIDFMRSNNITALNPLGAQAANELLGHHYHHNPNIECVYDLHNRALDGATLVLKG